MVATVGTAVLASLVQPDVRGQSPTPGAMYLSWSADQAQDVGDSMYEQGRVGGWFDTRLLKTERSYNYKLAATWLTPEVIRATARLAQLRERLSAGAAQQLVAEAEAIEGTVILVEIDPREGSGVIPLEWDVFLQPKDAAPDSGLAVVGTRMPALRTVRALAGTRRRNYDYDRFWVVFPLSHDGGPIFDEDVTEAELVVRIYDKEGHVRWRIPASIREAITAFIAKGGGNPSLE